MGKRIISQARGHGSLSYRVRRRAYMYKPAYPINMEAEYEVTSFVTEPGHTAPMAKLVSKNGKVIYNFAAKGLYVGQKITLNGKGNGDIAPLGTLENGTKVFNMELRPNDGGKLIKTSGSCAIVMNNPGNNQRVIVMMPSKQEKMFEPNCRVSVGEIAGQGRLDKPIIKAGRMWFIKKPRNKLWPRTSALKMNAIDHPFGSGRGKRPKSKIAKNNSPPGAKVGHLHPRRTGRKKK
jgi:large subunit ribosomal protein L2